MKRVIIGGMFVLIGIIWGILVIISISDQMVSSWSEPPGRFITTINQTAMTIPALISFLLLLTRLIILGIEYFRKLK